MAEPMTMTEVQKVLGREIKPATVEEDGYLVEYKDGYKSWSPKSVFDEAYASYNDFKDRLRIEHDELYDRLTKLNTALQKDGFREKVGDYQYKMMVKELLSVDFATGPEEAVERVADGSCNDEHTTVHGIAQLENAEYLRYIA